MAEAELIKLINDVTITHDGHLCGWVGNFEEFEENFRILTGVSFVTRNSRNSRWVVATKLKFLCFIIDNPCCNYESKDTEISMESWEWQFFMKMLYIDTFCLLFWNLLQTKPSEN